MRATAARARAKGRCALACAATVLLGIGGIFAEAAAQPAAPSSSGVEDLVRSAWFEGLPLDRAAKLGPEDGALLAEMLADPAEAPHHTNIVMALGACACGPAFEALVAFDAEATGWEADDLHARTARLAVPQAMGLLAGRDPRALDWLLAQTAAPTPAADDRPGRRRRSAVLDGLALTGAPHAAARLAELEAAARDRGDAAMQRRAALARARAAGGAAR
jgi:hypothetical protein